MDPDRNSGSNLRGNRRRQGRGRAGRKQILALLAKRTQRISVACAVSKYAKAEGIVVGWTKLGSWLKTEDVRKAIASGQPAALAQSTDRLALDVKPTGPDTAVAATRRRPRPDESLRP